MEHNTDILPSFLDRFEKRKINMNTERFKKSVMRDLSFLLSSYCHIKNDDIEGMSKRVKSSVLLYGLRSFVGHDKAKYNEEALEDIYNAIINFEPRIDPASLSVERQVDQGVHLKIKISGNLILPTKEGKVDLLLSIDIETGQTSIKKFN
ncbi:MAG: hypothetical protein GY756_14235 [bacterium]|nr:hypothetical protein [bacterium]